MSTIQPTPVPGAPSRAGAGLQHLKEQPVVGAVGLLAAVAIVLVLGVIIRPSSSLQILGSVTTFSLPVLIASALWWRGWPAPGGSRLISGLLNTALIVGSAVALTALAQIIVGRGDLSHLLSATPAAAPHGPGRPAFPSYPWTLPLAGLIFLTMVLLTFVCDRQPLRRLGTAGSGAAAIIVSWAVGIGAYELLANWSAVLPPPAQAALGLSNPGGPVSAFNLLGWTLCVAVWAVVLCIPFRGRPFAWITATGPRIVVANTVVIGLGWGMFRLLSGPLGLTVPELAAGCAAVIAASLIAALVFETWPSRVVSTAVGRDLALLATLIGGATVIFVVLKVIGDARGGWTPANPVYLWMTVCALNFLAAGSILWYAVWRRWPVAEPTPAH